MIFFDQHLIKQTDAMIAAAAAKHRVFLRNPQLGNGFTRIQDAAVGMPDKVGVAACQGGGA